MTAIMGHPLVTSSSNILEVKGLGKRFGVAPTQRWTFRNMSFAVRRGRSVTVLGASGCGKSTLLRILLGAETKSEGDFTVGVRAGREGFAYIPQEPNLLPWRTLLQNACLGLELSVPDQSTESRARGASARRRLAPRVSKDDVAGVDALVDQFGLRDKRSQLSGTLSGGERQRTAIIRALAIQPRLLLCDEPFSAVDFVSRLELNRQFKRNCRIRGIATVFVTHNIEEAIFLGDEIIILGDSPTRIVERIEQVYLSQSPEDPVACRESPEFGLLFRRIWAALEQWRVL